jgi:hypothetical protein
MLIEDRDFLATSNRQICDVPSLENIQSFGEVSKLRILVVDDEPFILTGIKIIFKSALR